MAKTKVVLLGEDGVTQHGSGFVDSDKIADTHLIERNGRTYAYHPNPQLREGGHTLAFFRECGPAVLITEF